jgi:prepilin-type N-terminal cleavage/methylation domain-containing protein
MPSKICSFKKGFTLIEILIVVVLLGMAMAAIVASNVAFTQATAQAAQLSTAEFLIEQIRELTALLPYNDVDGFNGAVFNPPIDCQQRQLTDFSDYSQAVTVENLSANLQPAGPDPNSPFVRVTVRILYQNNEITKASWIRSAD